MAHFYNAQTQKTFRQHLRNESTPAEDRLWLHLKGSQTGYKFRRQYGVGPYVVDFYCPELKLVIEIDGDSHFEPGAQVADMDRERYLHGFKMRVLRFSNQDVEYNIGDVMEVISRQFPEELLTTPNPSFSGLKAGSGSAGERRGT